MQEDLKALRHELGRIGRGRGARYPKDLKRRVAVWAEQQHSSGQSWGAIAERLGLGMETVRRWSVEQEQAPTGSRSLLPVRVVRGVGQQGATASSVSVSGWRIEGITVAEAAALIRALG